MKYGIPVQFPNGETYYIQSMPLCDLEKEYPKIYKADQELYDNQESVICLKKQAFEIVCLQNDVAFENFKIDIDAYRTLMSVWNGTYRDEKKKD